MKLVVSFSAMQAQADSESTNFLKYGSGEAIFLASFLLDCGSRTCKAVTGVNEWFFFLS